MEGLVWIRDNQTRQVKGKTGPGLPRSKCEEPYFHTALLLVWLTVTGDFDRKLVPWRPPRPPQTKELDTRSLC